MIATTIEYRSLRTTMIRNYFSHISKRLNSNEKLHNTVLKKLGVLSSLCIKGEKERMPYFIVLPIWEYNEVFGLYYQLLYRITGK
jgi:hypothetical protein